MFSIGVNNIYPLYLEVLKFKTLTFVEAILLGIHETNRSPRSTSKADALQDATILARRLNSQHYVVIAPFAGKAVVEAHIFEQSHKPIEPTRTRAARDSDNQIEKCIYQKYVTKD